MEAEHLLDALAERVADIILAKLATQETASPWLTVPEAADYCRLSEDAIRGAEKRGHLRAHRSETGRVRFLRDDLDRFLAAA